MTRVAELTALKVSFPGALMTVRLVECILVFRVETGFLELLNAVFCYETIDLLNTYHLENLLPAQHISNPWIPHD